MNRSRRRVIQGLGGLALTASLYPFIPISAVPALNSSKIRGTGEVIPSIGMGSSRTFNTAPFTDARDTCVEVLRAFFELGGSMVDSSPMYGLAEATIGHCLEEIGGEPPLFSATKVWIHGRLPGIAQMKTSRALWGVESFDLMQVHNLVDWDTQLETLREWKAEKRIRYIGVTTSHGRRHEGMEKMIRERPEVDFVQFSYNIADREAERRLLPAAMAHGKSVIINRPFRRGDLFDQVKGKPLPPWAGEIGCEAWSQFFLKFIVSHPAVTCAIPATSQVDHMRENMRALRGPLPDAKMRKKMVAYFEAL